MILNSNYRKFFLVGGSLVVLLVLGVVLGLTVVRIQNQKSTVTLPKAAGNGFISGCKYTAGSSDPCGTNPASGQYVHIYSYADVDLGPHPLYMQPYALQGLGLGDAHRVRILNLDGYNVEAVICNNRFVCYSGGRAYCRDNTTDGCSGSLPAASIDAGKESREKGGGKEVTVTIPTTNSPADGGTGQPHMDVHWRFYQGNDSLGGGGGGGAYYKALSPIGGATVSSLTPTFTWEANTTGINYNNVYVSENPSCNYDAATGQWFDGAGGLSNRSWTLTKPLKPNTTYYWNIYGSGPAGIHNAGCAKFVTGNVVVASRSCTVTLSGVTAAPGASVVATVNGSISSGTDSVYLWFSKQITATTQNATAKITPTPVTTPVLMAGPADYNYDSSHTLGGGDIFQYPVKICDATNGNCSGTVTLNQVALPTGNYNVFCQVGLSGGCSGQPLCTYKNGGINCGNNWQACGSSDGTTLTIGASTGCSADSDCTSPKVCAEGACVDPSQSHLGCGAANTCVRLNGAGNNIDGCNNIGGSCATSVNECQVCGGGNTRTCASGLHCSGNSSTVGVCVKDDGSTTCGACTSDNDCLLKALSCANNYCRETSQVNACWGNGGTNGKCYDCNGDGEVNILDFACFRNRYSQNVQ